MHNPDTYLRISFNPNGVYCQRMVKRYTFEIPLHGDGSHLVRYLYTLIAPLRCHRSPTRVNVNPVLCYS